jgi:hypothetical protein
MGFWFFLFFCFYYNDPFNKYPNSMREEVIAKYGCRIFFLISISYEAAA